ncbi:hypothetical protein ACL6C3_29805 [Capilliphycus salinus ALCB114379]
MMQFDLTPTSYLPEQLSQGEDEQADSAIAVIVPCPCSKNI